MNKHEHKCPYCGAVLTHNGEGCAKFLDEARENCPDAHGDLFAPDVEDEATDEEPNG